MRKNQILICKVRWLKYSVFSMLLFPFATTSAYVDRQEVNNIVVQKDNTRALIGQVLDDELGEPLIGASILVKESNTGVITDMDGRFSVQIPMKGATIVINYLGYKTQTIKVSDQGVLNIRMLPDSEMLNEVVVVGAGTQKKISVTGSISTVEGAELNIPSSQLTTGFAGKMAGVISRVSSGEPGKTSDFYIRGKSTFGGVNTPLIIMDGVEITKDDLDRTPAE